MILNVDKKVFNEIYLKYQVYNQKRTQIYFGGSSSGKSFSLAQRAILDLMDGQRNYLIVRKVQATIKRSVFNEVTKAISNFKLTKYFSINKSDLLITCTLNGKQILFCGLDDVEKIKSITPTNGVITDIWIEEATEVDYKDYKQLNKRLRGLTKVSKRMTLSFNPILQDHWIYQEFFDIWQDDKQYVETDSLSILKTTYKDNRFLSSDDIFELENETDRYYYDVYTLGNWGIVGSIIFKNWTVEDFDDTVFTSYYDGIDWGFSQDPFAYVKASLDKVNKIIYICDEICSIGLLNNESSKLVKEKLQGRIVTCDSATPQNIAEYNNLGVYAVPAKKGPGSIESGINWLKQFKIKIHPRCVNFKNEISKYKYKEDRNGNVLPVAIDRDNHLLDALRYAFESVMLHKEVKVKDRRLIGL